MQTSLLQAQIAMLDFQATRWLMDGKVPAQAGNNHPTMMPTGVYETADGFLNIAVTGQALWERFCRALGTKEWLTDPRFAKASGRSENRAALNSLIDERLRTRPSREWMSLFARSEVPAGPIYRIDEVFADPQVRHLGVTQEVHSPALGRSIEILRQPVSLSRSPSTIELPPPECGEHTDEILAEFGLSREEIAVLRRDGVV